MPGFPLLTEEWQIAAAMAAVIVMVWAVYSIIRRDPRGRDDQD